MDPQARATVRGLVTELRAGGVAIGERHVTEMDGAAGTPDEVIAKIATYADAGATRLYLQVLDLNDLDHLALVSSDVLPYV